MAGNTSFHLAPPPNFLGLDPDLSVSAYQRHLPHWRQAGATYFVTFRLGDALPQEQLDFLKRSRAEWERTHPPPQSTTSWEAFAEAYTTQAERWLDEGYGACYFRQRQWTDDLRDRLHRFQDQRYFLSCWSILPNHCHAVLRPLDDHPLEEVLGAIKGVTSRHIHQALGTSGALWEEESYDRIIRDDEHLWRVIQYIGRNPTLAGLQHEQTWRRWIHPDWSAAGWDFQ